MDTDGSVPVPETCPEKSVQDGNSPGTEEELMKELTHISEGQAGDGHDCWRLQEGMRGLVGVSGKHGLRGSQRH